MFCLFCVLLVCVFVCVCCGFVLLLSLSAVVVCFSWFFFTCCFGFGLGFDSPPAGLEPIFGLEVRRLVH